MATNNEIDAPLPITVPNGGTGDTTLTLDGVLYGNGTSAVGVTTAGNTNQVLTSNGAGNAPTFQAVSGIGWQLIQTQTASNSSSLVFSNTPSPYTLTIFVWTNIVPVSSNVYFKFSYASAGTTYFNAFAYNSSAGYTMTTNTQLSGNLANTAGVGTSGNMAIIGVANNGFGFNGGLSTYKNFSDNLIYCGLITGTSFPVISPVTFSMSSGNISSGTISQYVII